MLGTTIDKQTSVGGEDEGTNLSLANEKLREKKVGKKPVCTYILTKCEIGRSGGDGRTWTANYTKWRRKKKRK